MQRIDPRGTARDDLRIANFAAQVVNVIRAAAGARSSSLPIHDFSVAKLVEDAMTSSGEMSAAETIAFFRGVLKRPAQSEA